MEDIIGKVSATEKNPSTLQFFYFWTKAGYDIKTVVAQFTQLVFGEIKTC